MHYFVPFCRTTVQKPDQRAVITEPQNDQHDKAKNEALRLPILQVDLHVFP